MRNSLNSFRSFIHLTFICLMLTLVIQKKSFSQSCTGLTVITSSNDHSLPFGSGFTNTTVYIKSDFFINNLFSFEGCIIKIDPGIRIVVEAGKELTITNYLSTNSHLSACTDMWNGITIEGSALFGPGLLTVENNTLIEDAENAVLIPNSSDGIYRIQNSTFNKNWFHILVDHLPGNVYNGVLSGVSNTNFFCKDLTTNIYTTLLSPHSLARTNQAISYNAAGTGLGVMTIGPNNIIENADIGINNFNSHTDVISSEIYDCNLGYSGDWDGTMQLSNSQIHDCLIGIESTNMALVDIRLNQIYNISNTGIYIHLNRAVVNIIKNEMFEILDGIVIIDNEGDAQIDNNRIYNGTVLNYPNSHAIYVQQPILYPAITINVHANFIAQFEQGVFISTFNNVSIRGNYIDMDFIIPGLIYQIFAIKLEHSDFFGVNLNTIKGTTTGANYCDQNTCGIFIENSNDGGIICNEFGDPSILTTQFTFNKNLLMKGTVNANFIGGNKFRYEHLWSLFILDSQDGLGKQGDSYYVTDNEWYLSPGGIVQCGAITQDIISENSHLSSSAITEFNVRPNSILPPFTRFEHDLPIALSGLPANPNLVSTLPMDDQLCTFLRLSNGNLENSIADGSAFNANASDAYKWFSQNWLYMAIPVYPMYSTPFFSNFYNSLDNGNQGALKNISNQFTTSGSSGSIISTAIFVPSNSVEDNIKTVIDIGAQIHNQGINSISIAQKSTIDNLSVLCPQTDGPGVYMARAYRSLLDKHLYEYSSSCNGFGAVNLRTQHKNQTNFQSTALYYSKNELRIKSSTTELYNVDVIDMSGKIVFSTKINSNTSKYLDLPTGIYMYVMTEQNNANALRGKLTIMN